MLNDDRLVTQTMMINRQVLYSSELIQAVKRAPVEQWQAIRLDIGDRLRKYDRALFAGAGPGSAVVVVDAETPAAPISLTAADLATIRAELLREPMLLAIWFVDRLEAFYELRQHWPDYHQDLMFYPSLVYFDRATATIAEWAKAPWFAVIPGVWAEMSNGRHQYLMKYNDPQTGEQEELGALWIAPMVDYADDEQLGEPCPAEQ